MIDGAFILNLLCIAAGFSLLGLGAAYTMRPTSRNLVMLAFSGMVDAILLIVQALNNHPLYFLLVAWTLGWSLLALHEART